MIIENAWALAHNLLSNSCCVCCRSSRLLQEWPQRGSRELFSPKSSARATGVSLARLEIKRAHAAVLLLALAALCQEHGAGNGGWPTVKSFTAATPRVVSFPRGRPGMVCEELRAPGVLPAYVETVVAATRAAAEAPASEAPSEAAGGSAEL